MPIKLKVKRVSKKEKEFLYYPELDEKDFYKNIYIKKEFNKNKIQDETRSIEEICSPTEFRLMPQQNFLKNFISPETPYNGMLIFHGVGVGKCVGPDTKVTLFDNKTIKISNLWNQYQEGFYFDKDGMGEWISIADENIFVKSYNPITNKIVSRKVLKLYRQYIGELIREIKLKNKKTIFTTINHRLLTTNGWSNDYDTNNYIAFYNNSYMEYSKLSHHRIFPYRGYVYDLEVDEFHNYIANDIISHNTCSAISMAEQFKEIISNYGKKILVILGKNIRENFKKQIYDINKETKKKRKDDIVQCTGNTYTLPEEDRYLTRDQRIRKVRSNIKNYYQFSGYDQFANEVLRLTEWSGDLEELTPEIQKKISKIYSNRIIIIDEVQHVKSSSNIKKKVPPILEAVIKYGRNIRLVLMSATPMHDTPGEIVYLLNLLLLNDGRDSIDEKDIFEKNGELKKGGAEILKDVSKGYVSYLRGENPHTFPIRLYPKDAITPKVKYDINNNLLDPKDKIKFLKLVLCPMDPYQYKWYMETYKNKNNNNNNNENIDFVSNITEEEKERDFASKTLIWASNFIYPTKSGEGVYAKFGITNSDDGKGGFYKVARIINKRKRVSFRYQNHALKNIGTKDEEPILSKDRIHKYSNKFATALETIINAKGIVFVYSFHKPGGIIPFALMLEQNGVLRYESEGENQLLEYSRNSKGGGGKNLAICYYCGKVSSDPIHNAIHKNYHKFYIARYILLTGDVELTKITTDRAVELINNDTNKIGQEIKIILGTTVIGEGIDFKNIRQVHIIEPWYNIPTLEQIIGRGIRNCSHVALPEEERNVEVYQYASVAPEKANKIKRETETIDLKNYRISETKDVKIKKVERILKESAVDCALNKKGNIFPESKEIMVRTASGHHFKYRLGDKVCSRVCDYQENCKYTCDWYPDPKKPLTINMDTYNLKFAKSDIQEAKKYIKRLYLQNIIYDLKTITKYVKKRMPDIDDKFIYKALDDFVRNKNEFIYDKYDREGYLIYRGHYYIYQPKELDYEKIPLYYREQPLTIKSRDVPIEPYLLDLEKRGNINENRNKNVITNFEHRVELYMNQLNELIRTNNIKNPEDIIIGMVIDRLNKEEITILFKKTINNYLAKKIQSLEADILEYMDKFLLKTSRNLEFSKIPKKEGEIFGFRYGGIYYCVKNSIWSICSNEIKRKVELTDKLREVGQKKVVRKENLLFGLINITKKDIIKFQIVDKKKYIEAITLTARRSKRSEITGRVCDTYQLEQLYRMKHQLGAKDPFERKKKDQICMELEFLFRFVDKRDTVKKWFHSIHDKI